MLGPHLCSAGAGAGSLSATDSFTVFPPVTDALALADSLWCLDLGPPQCSKGAIVKPAPFSCSQ